MKAAFVGEQVFINILGNIIDAPPSVLAFMGEPGSGKTYAAQYVASHLLDQSDLGLNPNFYSIDGRTAGIDGVRVLQKNLSLSVPGTANVRRIAVIEHFDGFGHEAQNALLKTFEEPPLDTLLIITVDKLDSVLPTIWSRVHKIQVPKISLPTARKYYEDLSEAEIKKAHAISGGNTGLLAGLLENPESHELAKAIEEAKELLKLPKYQRLARVDSISKGAGTQPKLLLDAMARILHASYQQIVLSGVGHKELKSRAVKLKACLDAIDDIDRGVSAKLSLTRLFLAV